MWFTASLTAQGVWALAYAAGLFVLDPQLRAAAEALAWIGMNCTGPFFLAFAIEYTGLRPGAPGSGPHAGGRACACRPDAGQGDRR